MVEPSPQLTSPAALICTDSESPELATLVRLVESTLTFTLLEVPAVMVATVPLAKRLKLKVQEFPVGLQEAVPRPLQSEPVLGSINRTLILVPFGDTAAPDNLKVTVLTVASYPISVVKVKVATSSADVLVRPEVEPKLAPDNVNLVLKTVSVLPFGALLPEDKVMVEVALEDLPRIVTWPAVDDAIRREWVALLVAPPEVKLATSPFTVRVIVPF